MLTLYFAPGKSSMAAHIGLHEVGETFERVLVRSSLKENREPSYLALNPEGKVPTLVIDGRPLTEVAAILYYLARRHPEAALMPRDNPELEAHVLSWMSFTASTIHPARQRDMAHRIKIFQIANARLGKNEWTAGGAYSIADIHLFRLYWRFVGRDQPSDQFPNLNAHYARMMERPAVKRTIEIEKSIGYELPA